MAIFKNSLQARLTLILILIALIPMLLVTVLGYWQAHQSLEDLALEAVNSLAPSILALLVLVVFIVIIVAFILARSITQPIRRLVHSSHRLAKGELDAFVPVISQDEIGQLARNFQDMVIQLRDLIGTLENRVQVRTQALETNADISRRITQILDIDELLQDVVSHIQTEFGFYHTHVYLLDKQTGDLLMAEGSGTAGQQLKAQQHKLRLGRGIVGGVAESGEASLTENVIKNLNYVHNPLLPNTKSELAVPLRKGGDVLGVLDMQSDEQGAFTQDDTTLMQSIADQLAVAIDNARLFEQTQQALAEIERTHQQYLTQSWEVFRDAQAVLQAEQQKPDVSLPLDKLKAIKQQAIAQGQIIKTEAEVNNNDNDDDDTSQTALVTPLKLQGQVIGTLGVQEIDNRYWSEDEIALIEAVSEQITQALERARLFGETQQRAAREKIIADMTQQIWASEDIEKVMQTAVEQLSFTMDASKVVIKLGTASQLMQQFNKNDETQVS